MSGNLHITGFHSGIALWLGLLLLALSLAATAWHYRATNPPVSRTVRRVLGLGRGLAFAAALLMLISPAVQWVSTRRATPELLVFQDASLSMRRVEAGQPRWRRASDVLKSVREELGSRVAVRSYLFGTTVRRSRGELRDSTDAADQGTDLAQPLHAAMDSLIS
ncbi:MAG TPA: VWA domain-containing protein, partial [Bacteroidetes bacterium]|nr:VWA domain-containing protein [Bacteroidota bacterium]